jgi:ribonucleoside-diphosphate reductase alpha chain
MPTPDENKASDLLRQAEDDWRSFDEYLTATRYAVRDPETGEPLEKDYRSIVSGRVAARLRSMESPLAEGELTEDLIRAIEARQVIPASPLLMSFGNPHTRRPGYFSCYPLGWVGDSLAEIEETRRRMRSIYMAGGGAGIDLSKLRPKGSPVDSGQGAASGPVGFLPDFDSVTGTTNQGGRRRGALLVQLDWDHPDIVDFVRAKNFNAKLNQFIQGLPEDERPLQSPNLSNMNISVNVFGKFWDDVKLVRLVAENMWATGDPGLLFVDNMLRFSPLRAEDEPRFSNPCGEYLASAMTACNLVTVNAARLARHSHDALIARGLVPGERGWADEFGLDFWPRLSRAASLACYLGNLILEFDEGYPLPEIRERTQQKKPVGVGMSGFHTALLLAYEGREVYGGAEAIRFARRTQASLTLGSLEMSARLARKSGVVYENPAYWTTHLAELSETLGELPATAFAGPVLEDLGRLVEERGGFHNCLTTSQAPTGSVSCFLRVVDTGIEPFYALNVERRVRDDRHGWLTIVQRPLELVDLFERRPELLERTKAQTALSLTPEDQIRMLAAFQYHNHTGISKTVNLPKATTVEEIENLVFLSRDLRLKGFTVYRDGALENVLSAAGQARAGGPIEILGDDRPGRTYTARSVSLTAHITLNNDKRDNIREIFVRAGETGADINALFEAFGMILSVSLRKDPDLFDDLVKVLNKVNMDQNVTIRTHMSEEPIRGSSLPQAIGRLMTLRREYLKKGSQIPVPREKGAFDLCPGCYKLSLRREGSCRKCELCGYTTC